MFKQKVYVGQTALIIRLHTHVFLAGVSSVKIRYEKPSGSPLVGEWEAEIFDNEIGIIQYVIQSADDLDEPGAWTCWAYVTFNDGTIAQGQPAKFIVYREGE